MTEKNTGGESRAASALALTLNPAMDITIGLSGLAVGQVNRAQTYRADAGGKGINVAAMLAAGGFKTAATGILGEDNAAFFQKFFAARGIEDRFIYVQGATRNNIKLVSARETTDVNLPGLAAAPAVLEKLYALLAQAKAEFLVLSGSVPPQCPDSFYADFLEFYAKQGGSARAKCVADCSGKPLKALLGGKARPYCIKPNQDELAEWAGKELTAQDEILRQAQALNRTGIALVVVSMGSRGALFVAGDAAYHAAIKLDKVESTVGAGDAMVAGIVAACLRHERGADTITAPMLADIAKNATLWAAAKLQCRGANFPPAAVQQALAAKIRCEKCN